MNHFCLLGISSKITCYTVIKTHSHSNKYIAFIGINIRPQISMHT